ncbi:unnamed protein product [Fusarium venenatum]|uniref:Uncharacterized protein n=1 Tax=Fusarium venenatum TaxID=56646 RepID=A0A2L2TLA1_9HYPO|nr:uncharacterized protein FVRRES_00458 [Fusarium venenatum]CEI63946.1 unnamed protein product [Fusarium venenatum]
MGQRGSGCIRRRKHKHNQSAINSAISSGFGLNTTGPDFLTTPICRNTKTIRPPWGTITTTVQCSVNSPMLTPRAHCSDNTLVPDKLTRRSHIKAHFIHKAIRIRNQTVPVRRQRLSQDSKSLTDRVSCRHLN